MKPLQESVLRKISNAGRSIVEMFGSIGRGKEWKYDYFREYLLALSRGDNFLLPRRDYKKRVRLDENWHDVLDTIRRESKDGVEKYSVIGVNKEKRAVFVREVPLSGHADHVPVETIHLAVDEMERKVGADLVVDIHSHPDWLLSGLWGDSKEVRRAAFSPGDLFRLIHKSQSHFVGVLVEGNENLFVFRTRGTERVDLNLVVLSQQTFTDYWLNYYGFRRFRLGSGTEVMTNQNKKITGWDVNVGIAERHKLVIYRGLSGGDLFRVVP